MGAPWRRSVETITQFRGSAITLSAAAFLPKDSISLPLRRDVDRAERGRETAEAYGRFHPGGDVLESEDRPSLSLPRPRCVGVRAGTGSGAADAVAKKILTAMHLPTEVPELHPASPPPGADREVRDAEDWPEDWLN